MNDKLKTYLILIGIALLVTVLVAVSEGLFSSLTLLEVLRSLSDGFFLGAATVGGIGLLQWCRNEGAFDGISYSVSSFLHYTFGKSRERKENYAEYVERKHAKAKSIKEFLIVGLGFLLVAIALIVAFSILIS